MKLKRQMINTNYKYLRAHIAKLQQLIGGVECCSRDIDEYAEIGNNDKFKYKQLKDKLDLAMDELSSAEKTVGFIGKILKHADAISKATQE